MKQLEAEERKRRMRAGQDRQMPQLPLFPDEDAGTPSEGDGPTAE